MWPICSLSLIKFTLTAIEVILELESTSEHFQWLTMSTAPCDRDAEDVAGCSTQTSNKNPRMPFKSPTVIIMCIIMWIIVKQPAILCGSNSLEKRYAPS
jgi:hypothetical protein